MDGKEIGKVCCVVFVFGVGGWVIVWEIWDCFKGYLIIYISYWCKSWVGVVGI